MKLRLPIALLAAVVCSMHVAQAASKYDDTITWTSDSNATSGKAEIDLIYSDNFYKYELKADVIDGTYTYSVDANGTVTTTFEGVSAVGAHSCVFFGPAAYPDSNEPYMYSGGEISALHPLATNHSAVNTDITVSNDAETWTSPSGGWSVTADTKTVVCSGIQGDYISGNRTVTVTGQDTYVQSAIGGSKYVFGCVWEPTDEQPLSDKLTCYENVQGKIREEGKGSTVDATRDVYYNSGTKGSTITVNVADGARVGAVYGADYMADQWVANAGADSDGNSGNISQSDVAINVTGGAEVGTIYASMDASVAGAVKVDVSGGSKVTNLYGGGQGTGVNVYVQSTDISVSGDGTTVANIYGGGYINSHVAESTNIEITGGKVGTVYGGSFYGVVGGGATGDTATAVDTSAKTAATIQLSGGEVTGNVYAGGYGGGSDIVGDAKVIFTGAGTTVGGKIYGTGNGGSQVLGNSILAFEEYKGDTAAVLAKSEGFDVVSITDGSLETSVSVSLADAIITNSEVHSTGSNTMSATGSLAMEDVTLTFDVVGGNVSAIAMGTTGELSFTGSASIVFAQDGENQEFTYTVFSDLLEGSVDTAVTQLSAALESGSVSILQNGETTAVSDYQVMAVGNNIVITTAAIPEPTTATLSLLALAGLAARRRRR